VPLLDDKDRELYLAHLSANYRAVLGTQDGVAVIRHILDRCGFFKETFTGNSRSFYLQGRASIGRSIMTEIAVFNPKAFAKIMVEGLKEQYKINKERNKGGEES
jgi:hypothetical protein